MTSRLVMTNQGLEVTPGNIETMDVYFQSNKNWIATADAFEFSFGITLHAWNSTLIFPLWVQATTNTGLILNNTGRLTYARNSDVSRYLEHPSLILEIGVYKQIRIWRHTNASTTVWSVDVDGVFIGDISGTLTINPDNLNSIGGNTILKPPVFTIHDIILNSPGYYFYFLFQGDGRALYYDEATLVMPNSAVNAYGITMVPMGTIAGKNPYVFVTAPVEQGSYYIESVVVPANTKGLWIEFDPIEVDWKTQSFALEVTSNVTNWADKNILGNKDSTICRWVINGSEWKYLEALTGVDLRFLRPDYPSTVLDNPFNRRIYSWNHLTNQMTVYNLSTVDVYTLDKTTFTTWNGVYPKSVFTHIGGNHLVNNTIVGGLGPINLMKIRLTVDGVERLHINTELMSPPPIEEKIKDPLGYYYNVVPTPGKRNVKIYNAQRFWKWTPRQNSIEYTGPLTLPNVLSQPNTPGVLTVAEVLSWFRTIDGNVEVDLVTDAEYSFNVGNETFSFPWTNSSFKPFVVRAYVKHITGDSEGLAGSPPFLVLYGHDPVAFEPDCFEDGIFDTTDNLPPFITEDGFESAAFDNDVFEMNPSGPPAEKLRMLKYYTGSAWTGVPIKMWAGSAWTEVQLKVCTSGSTFTKISG